MLSNLALRDRRPELMDDPALDSAAHAAALRGLARINKASRSDAILWPALAELASTKSPLRILDVATGAGDVPIALWRRARQAGLNIEFAACDVSETALSIARENAQRAGAWISFFQHDVVRESLSEGFDAVICSLFLHHLDEAQATVVLGRMKDAASCCVLVNDLRRSNLGYVVAWLGCRLLSRSPVVHVDGPLSVQGAFTIREAERLASTAGLTPVSVTNRWPFRFLLRWDRP